MAHKSKTQRAKAATAKANKKDRELRDAAAAANAGESQDDAQAGIAKSEKKESKPEKKQAASATKKETKPKKTRFQFLKDVRAEMKRVTWPTRTDVARWSGVVVGALVFFGVYVAILDNAIITPGLVFITGLGA